MRPKIQVLNVTKTYSLYHKERYKLLKFLFSRKSKKSFHALYNVSFDIFEGETVGIIGLNGAGKSTLSNLLAQVVPPTKGEVKINGIASLIAIGAGLNGLLTGIENIYMRCYMSGLTKSKVDKILPDIIQFADIGDFIHQPIKSYSSGMKSRLGFAIAIHLNPDILIIDEALSVGDSTFYQKCLNKMNQFKEQGKTIVFISHSDQQVKSFCDRVIWLEHGQVRKIGESEEVVQEYRNFVNEFNRFTEEEKLLYKREHSANQYIKNIKKRPTKEEKKASLDEKVGNIILILALLNLVLIKALFFKIF